MIIDPDPQDTVSIQDIVMTHNEGRQIQQIQGSDDPNTAIQESSVG